LDNKAIDIIDAWL